MPEDCSSRIMWLETGADITMPSSAKKQKLSTSHQSSDQVSSGDIFTLLPFKRACMVVKTPLPALSTSALDVSLVCSWKRVDQPNVLSCEVAELGRVSLSVAEVVSGALNCSEESLLLWNGETISCLYVIASNTSLGMSCFYANSFLLRSWTH